MYENIYICNYDVCRYIATYVFCIYVQVLMLTCFSTASVSYDEVGMDTSLAITSLYKTKQLYIRTHQYIQIIIIAVFIYKLIIR